MALDADKTPEQTWIEFTAVTEAFLKTYAGMARAANTDISYDDIRMKFVKDVLSMKIVSMTHQGSGPKPGM